MKQVGIDAIRNVAFLGHNGAGKTSLAEAMMFAAGNIDRLGRVDDGSTMSDFDDDEKKRKISINTSVLPVVTDSGKINILDTPGFLDFSGDVVGALRIADSAILVSRASVSPEVGFEIGWDRIKSRSLPGFIFVNKMDRENADYSARVKEYRSLCGTSTVPLIIPIGQEANFAGVINILTMKSYTKDGVKDIGEDADDDIATYREWIMEAAAEGSDELMEKYLEEGELSAVEVMEGIAAGVKQAKVYPIACGSSTTAVGIQALIDLIFELMPSPNINPEAVGSNPADQSEISRKALESEPLSAFVFKTTSDPFVGKITYFKVMSGTLKSDSHVFNASKGKEERVGSVSFVRGKSQATTPVVGPGDIAALTKLQFTGTNDTLCDKAKPIVYPPTEFPAPCYHLAVKATTKADEDRLSNAIQKIAEEDPTFGYHRDPITGQTIISGLGDTHLDVIVARMKRKFGTSVENEQIRIPYKETVNGKARAQGRHKKQTGGRGQFGDCWLRIEPLPRGEGYQFVDEIFGGAIPKNYIPSVEKGVKAAMDRGVLAGYPVVDCKVTVDDGSVHPVDSSDAAFQQAGIIGFNNVVNQANPVLLEPVMKVEVIIPKNNMGEVISDFNGKRGRVLGMESVEGGKQKVTAMVPQSEMLSYAVDLRAITRGMGVFTADVDHYDEVPGMVAAKIIEAYKKEREKDKSE